MTDHDEGGSPPGETALRAKEEVRGRGLSDHTQKRIGLHLRALYDQIVEQPVPDRFRDLIAQLEATPSDDPAS